ncbi:MAG: HAD family hydrolase [Cyanobacteriota bacterium ELA615]
MQPSLLALDFDGVLCNGLKEYFQTAKQAYQQIWPSDHDLAQYAESFYRLRPIVEHGWEMPLIIRAMLLEHTQEQILTNWPNLVQSLLKQENIQPSTIIQQIDRARDVQIAEDFPKWLSLQEFYPGVIEKLRQIQDKKELFIYIITTKEGRFARKLLERADIFLPAGHIIGKEVKQPKAQTLLDLSKSTGITCEKIWFVEDRLETLQLVQKQGQLKGIGLFLADWGYNLAKIRQEAQNDQQINLLSLEQFQASFGEWPNKDVRFSQTSS